MYFKIRKNILFREYEMYGYITDNSLFGYRMLDDNTSLPGERYVSKSGAAMLNTLSKEAQHIDDIVKKLSEIFIDVDIDELKSDTIDFFLQFVNDGFLCYGETIDKCNGYEENSKSSSSPKDNANVNIVTENCSKKIFTENDFLRSIHIEIANECNERCVHCYIPHECKSKVMDSDLFYKILEDGRSMNIINVVLSGGEPLIHSEFLGFLAKCRELDLSVNVLTNLTLITEEIILEMKRNPLLSVQTSLYSMDPLIHDSITKVKGSFEKTKDGIMKLLLAGVPLQISCPIMKQNQDSFDDVIKWGKHHNIPVSTDYVIFASYDNSNSNLINRLSLFEVEKAIDKQISKEYVEMLSNIAKEKNALSANDPICSICRYNFCVSAEGYVFPCVGWQTNRVGDLTKHTIKEVWENSDQIQRLRNIKRESFPKCVKCEDRGYCTVCMMNNSNENKDKNEFLINDYHCKVASILHNKVDLYVNK